MRRAYSVIVEGETDNCTSKVSDLFMICVEITRGGSFEYISTCLKSIPCGGLMRGRGSEAEQGEIDSRSSEDKRVT